MSRPSPADSAARRTMRYTLDASASTLTVCGKSSLHPLTATVAPAHLDGNLECRAGRGLLDASDLIAAHLEFPAGHLSFGNALYDRELPRHLDTKTYPMINIDLDRAVSRDDGRWSMDLTVGMHGITRAITAPVTAIHSDDGALILDGTYWVDVTDFGITPPSKLGMRVHPSFEVTIHAVGRAEDRPGQ